MLGLGLGIGVAQTAPLKRYSIGGKAPAVVADYSAGVYGLNGTPVAFDGLFSFARLSAAWKRNALGHWVKVVAGEPRTGHHIWQGGQLVPAGVAICSEVRTNQIPYSEDFTGSYWAGDIKTQGGITPNTHISPDGTMTASTVTSVGATPHLYQEGVVVEGQRKSIYARTVNGTGTVALCSFYGVAGAVVELTEQWQRFDLGWEAGDPGRGNFYAVDFRAGTLTEAVIWGAQLEDGPYATDYIKTEGAPVSVAAEDLQIAPVELARAVGSPGPELLTNGGFESDLSGWDDISIGGGSATWVDGTLQIDRIDGSNTGWLNQGFATVIGQTYLLRAERFSGEGAALRISYASGAGHIYDDVLASGVTEVFFTATSTTTWVNFRGAINGSTTRISDVEISSVTMPEALTLLINGTMTRAKEPASRTNAIPMRWFLDTDNSLDMLAATDGASTGKPYFRNENGGSFTQMAGIVDALALGVEEEFSLAFVLSATEIEGFYNGASTGTTAYGGMANLLSAPLQIFPVGNATVKEIRVWTEALPSADMVEATA